MKNTILTSFIILALSVLSFGQTIRDTKDFLIEQIEANDPISSYDNFVLFQNILKVDAEELAGRRLTDDEFKHLFIYGRECYRGDNKTGGVWLTVAESIDIRGMTKVSTTRTTGEYNYYKITVYMSGTYHKKIYTNSMGKKENKYLSKMEILISDNKEAAVKIKKALIYLGQLHGVTVKDGDMF